ncbi:fluoride efflux transporter CrcB [Roseomonas sp. JC162]|uniref:Fluoride-specific ion channel FluC n=1 Tax=Neoroseomonas marina TaxID=1232220 RepID=A0A848EKW0_9PROT|nr:CrcB family protein [Neoroseomonas marina]NMJ44145.1 fluoride efflux transporter CrcB [Neoroseomonas marina]
MTAVLLVAIGGAAGSVLRYLTSVAALEWLGPAFPWGTLTVNAVGSFVIGAMAGAGVEGNARFLLVTGLLGGFTTFSAFSLEATMLWERAPVLSVAYVAASVALGVACCVAGFWLFRR